MNLGVFIRDSINWEAWLDRAQKEVPLNSGTSKLLALLRDPVAAVIGRGRTADEAPQLPDFQPSRWGSRDQVAAVKRTDLFRDGFDPPRPEPFDLSGRGRPLAVLAAAPSKADGRLGPMAFTASLADLGQLA